MLASPRGRAACIAVPQPRIFVCEFEYYYGAEAARPIPPIRQIFYVALDPDDGMMMYKCFLELCGATVLLIRKTWLGRGATAQSSTYTEGPCMNRMFLVHPPASSCMSCIACHGRDGLSSKFRETEPAPLASPWQPTQ